MSTMKSQQTVYYGPNSSTYPSVGTVFAGENITVLWRDCSGWYHIQYTVTSTGKYNRGYVPDTTVNVTGTVVNLQSTVAQNSLYYCTAKTDKSKYDTYTGPGNENSYKVAGSISKGEQVKFLYQTNGYAFIDYSISGGQRKRAYTARTNLNISQ